VRAASENATTARVVFVLLIVIGCTRTLERSSLLGSPDALHRLVGTLFPSNARPVLEHHLDGDRGLGMMACAADHTPSSDEGTDAGRSTIPPLTGTCPDIAFYWFDTVIEGIVDGRNACVVDADCVRLVTTVSCPDASVQVDSCGTSVNTAEHAAAAMLVETRRREFCGALESSMCVASGCAAFVRPRCLAGVCRLQ
jgi:hypothetical protein